MANKVAIYYHNPRCSKSRQGLQLLQEKGLDFTTKEYLKVGLTSQELSKIFKMLDQVPVRRKETTFKELALDQEPTLTEWAQIIADNPILLERPLLVLGQKAVVGRPPEDLLSIL